MALTDELKPATDMFSGGISNLLSWAWVLIPLVVLIAIALGAFIWKKSKDKNSQ